MDAKTNLESLLKSKIARGLDAEEVFAHFLADPSAKHDSLLAAALQNYQSAFLDYRERENEIRQQIRGGRRELTQEG